MAVRAVEPRLEPHDIDAEQAVIGSCLIDREVIASLSALLAPEDFLRHSHVVTWRALLALWARRVPADVVTVVAELRRAGTLDDAGGEVYLAELIAATPTAAHAEHYARVVREASVRRQLIRAAGTIAGVAWDEALALGDAIARAEAAVRAAAESADREDVRSLGDIMTTIYQTIDEPAARVIPTGVVPLDRIIGGVMPGQLVVIAARPASGKTALAIQIAAQQARRRTPVGFISLEMDGPEIGERVIGMYSGVNMHRVRAGWDMDEAQRGAVSHALGMASELPIYIRQRANNRFSDVIASARALVERRRIRFLVVDYLQLMHVAGLSSSANRTQEVGQMSAGLKRLARELGIVVVCLSQLSRASEHRNPPVPMLSDLRDSGSIEQDADIVVLIHREDVYDTTAPPGSSRLIVAKHRSGPVGTAHARFVPHTSQFLGWEAV